MIFINGNSLVLCPCIKLITSSFVTVIDNLMCENVIEMEVLETLLMYACVSRNQCWQKSVCICRDVIFLRNVTQKRQDRIIGDCLSFVETILFGFTGGIKIQSVFQKQNRFCCVICCLCNDVSRWRIWINYRLNVICWRLNWRQCD